MKHANDNVCSRHRVPSTVDNGPRWDHDDGEGDIIDAVAAGYAKAMPRYRAHVVMIARTSRVKAGSQPGGTARGSARRMDRPPMNVAPSVRRYARRGITGRTRP